MGNLDDDAMLVARKLAVFTVGLYASPTYLKKHGTPKHLPDLAGHSTLRLLQRSGEAAVWHLSQDNKQISLAPAQRAAINLPELLIRLARHAGGIAAVPDPFVYIYMQSGELVPVLPDWSLPQETAWAIFLRRRLMPARTRVFLDAPQDAFSGPTCQAQEESVREIRKKTS